jgi:hypothetical protein
VLKLNNHTGHGQMSDYPLPGLIPRRLYAKQVNRSERTLKRWEDAGQLVVRRQGNECLVDVEGTAARLRGEDRHRGRKGGRSAA